MHSYYEIQNPHTRIEVAVQYLRNNMGRCLCNNCSSRKEFTVFTAGLSHMLHKMLQRYSDKWRKWANCFFVKSDL